MLLPPRRAVIVDKDDLLLNELFEKLLRIGDRGRAADELGGRPVERRNAFQTPDEVGQMAPENAPVRVDLVDNDVLQVLEQLDPLRVMGQDALMEHVGIRHDDVPHESDGLPRRNRRVSVERVRLDVHA